MAEDVDSNANELKAHLQEKRAAEAARIAENAVREYEAKREAAALQATEAAAPKFIAEHTLEADETLSHLALKYYGHSTPPYWRFIYEANKDVVGDNPNRVRRGMVIKIPVLPPDFKG